MFVESFPNFVLGFECLVHAPIGTLAIQVVTN
jgi:hypothetical protein